MLFVGVLVLNHVPSVLKEETALRDGVHLQASYVSAGTGTLVKKECKRRRRKHVCRYVVSYVYREQVFERALFGTEIRFITFGELPQAGDEVKIVIDPNHPTSPVTEASAKSVLFPVGFTVLLGGLFTMLGLHVLRQGFEMKGKE